MADQLALLEQGDPEDIGGGGGEDAGYLEVGDAEQDLTGNDPDSRPKAAWQTTSATIVSNMIGVGVLGLPYAVRAMGWWLFLLFFILMALISLYSALIIGWLRGTFTSLRSYADVAAHSSSARGERTSKFFYRLTQAILYSLLLGLCTVYLITMKISLEQVLQKCRESDASSGPWPGWSANGTAASVCGAGGACSSHGIVHLPDVVWLFLSAVLLFPFVHFRSLAQAPYVMYIGVGTIVIVNIIILIRAMDFAGSSHHKDVTFHRDLSLRNIVNGMTTIAFAFGGHAVMVDILADMRDPRHFPRAIYWAEGIMVVNYALIAFIGYAAFGDQSQAPVTLNLPRDGVTVFANVCLLLHVAVAYCINSTVLVRNWFNALWPGSLYRSSYKRTNAVRWGLLSSLVLLMSFVLSVLVPFFDDIMDVISAYGMFTLSIWMPALLLLLNQGARVSATLTVANVVIVILGLVGMVLGIWASIDDAIQKLRDCEYHFARN